MQKYEFIAVCGEGFYGTVFRSRVKGTKRVVAIKQFKGAEDYATKREIEVLSRLRHPNIIQLVEVLRPKGKLHMVFEFLDNDLLNILSKEYKEGMPENLVQPYIQQLCRGLEYCHERNIIHRDIKPENCLISITDGSLKLCDFGEARVVHAGDKKLSAIIGTRWYRAPEILSGSKTTTSQTGSNAADCGSIQKVVRPKLLEYTNVSDLWGVGCIMGELLIGTPMYPADTDLQQLAVVKKFSTVPQLHKRMEQKNVTSEGMSLLTGLLTLVPAKRLTATTALAHPYYTNHGDDKSKVVKAQSSGGHGDDGVVDEVDDSFDGDFSDVEDDDYTDDDAFDDEDTSMDDASRPDSPEVSVYNAVYKAPPLHHGKSEADSKSARHQATTEEASGKKHRRSKGKRKKKDKRGAEEKTQNADKAEALEQLPPRHPKKKKKKHRQHKEDRAHKTRADKTRHKKSSKHTSHNRRNDDASTNASRSHRRKREVPSYARATTAASVRSKSKSKASKDKKGSRKKRHRREKM